MRGGNRQVALIGLELISVVVLLGIWARLGRPQQGAPASPDSLGRSLALVVLLSSPLWLALVYLVPLSPSLWTGLPGRSQYQQLLSDAGIAVAGGLPLSLTPDATAASLLAGIPLVAAFLAGYAARLSQLHKLLLVFVAMAFLQVLLGLIQLAGGGRSSLNFSSEFGGAIGSFANTNHFANYVAMALVAYVWLTWHNLTQVATDPSARADGRFTERHALALWLAGGIVLVIGILVSRSRGAALAGLPAAALAVGVAAIVGGGERNWRRSLLLVGGVFAVALALAGVGSFVSKFNLANLATDSSFRGLLASSTLAGAREFWPWGAGWGSYGAVYPRFQPISVDGYAEHAHQDYAQMLFEGGIFSLVLTAAFLWLAIGRALLLTVSALRNGKLNSDEMAAALCGLGLLGLLVHSLVEFNMHIPANAIAGSLLAGVYLRPLAARVNQ